MPKREWIVSKKYPGVKWCQSERQGKTYYITYRRSGKFVWEKVGSEKERYTLEDAATVRATRIKAIRHGEELPRDQASIPYFAEIAERFLEWASHHKKSWKDDAARYRQYLAPRFGRVPVNHITSFELERLKRDVAGEGKAPGTIRQIMALFRAIFNKGRSWGLISVENPSNAVKMPRVDNARERFLSTVEAGALLEHLRARSQTAYGLALMGLNTGARLGEIFGLRWSDVDLNARTLVFRDTKNGRTRRIPLNDEAHEFLSSLPRGTPTGAVFATGDGRRVRYITSAFQRAADELFNKEVPKGDRRNRVVFHTLRHTAASHMVMGGVPLATVKEILGHRSFAMVERYAHFAPEAQREAVQILGNRVSLQGATTKRQADNG